MDDLSSLNGEPTRVGDRERGVLLDAVLLFDAQAAIVEGKKQVLRHVAAQQLVDASAAEHGTERDSARVGVRRRVVLQRVEKVHEWSQRSGHSPLGKRHVAQHSHRPRFDHAEELMWVRAMVASDRGLRGFLPGVEARVGAGVEAGRYSTHDTCFCEVTSAGGTARSAASSRSGDEPIREELRPAKGFSRERAEVVA